MRSARLCGNRASSRPGQYKTAKTLDYIPKTLIAPNAGWVDPAFVQEMRADIEGHITRSRSRSTSRRRNR